MDSILPIISMTELQRNPKACLARLSDYAVIQSHGHDRAFVLSPKLGRILLESGMLDTLRSMQKQTAGEGMETQLRGLIGSVLRELSKK